ncbi:MAG: hypothetical protein ACRDPW_10040 [Mycobacteriales bacterium]
MTPVSSVLPADHEPFVELAAGWTLDALKDSDRATFADHLPICPPCQRVVVDFSEVLTAVASQVPDAVPPQILGERIRVVAMESAPGTASVRLADGDGDTVGRVLVHGDQLHVIAEGLPRNKTRRNTYVLWSLPHGEGAPPRAVTPFDVDRYGAALGGAGSLDESLAGISAFAVSIERGRAMPPSPTKVVASGASTSGFR